WTIMKGFRAYGNFYMRAHRESATRAPHTQPPNLLARGRVGHTQGWGGVIDRAGGRRHRSRRVGKPEPWRSVKPPVEPELSPPPGGHRIRKRICKRPSPTP